MQAHGNPGVCPHCGSASPSPARPRCLGPAPESLPLAAGWAPCPCWHSSAPAGRTSPALGTRCSPRLDPSDPPQHHSGTPVLPTVTGRDVPGAWLESVGAPDGVGQLPWLPALAGPPFFRQKKGPLIAHGGLPARGLCYSSALRCVPTGPPHAWPWGLCFSWPGMCPALLGSDSRGPRGGPFLPAGARPRAKQGLLRAHLERSCGEEAETRLELRLQQRGPPQRDCIRV